MPLLIHAVWWWLTGLYLGAGDVLPPGMSGFSVAVCAVIVALGTTVARTSGVSASSGRWAALWLVPAGLVVAQSALREREACKRVLSANAAESERWVLLHDTPMPRTTVKGVVQERRASPRCRISGWFRTAAREAAARDTGAVAPRAGSLVPFTGATLPSARGVRVDQAEFGAAVHTERLIAWRAAIGLTIDTLFRSRAPLVRALLIADQDGIAPEIRDRYADAGLVHMLSVSGMHVAIIASALLALGGMLRIPQATLAPASLVLVTLYVALLGFPAPAVRSGVMLGVMALAAQMQRPVHEWTALALGAVIPTVDPLVVVDLGWQLSVGGMAALVAARGLRRRWRAHAQRHRHASRAIPAVSSWLATRRGISGWLVQEIFTGVVATLVTAPIIAWTFGRVSLIAPLSNIPGGALVALLQPALFLALLVTPIPGAGPFVADATQPLMALLDALAGAAAAVPGAVLPVAPSLMTVLGTGVAAACIVRGSAHPRPTRWWIGAATSVVVALWASLLRGGSGQFEMHVLDVGQGDAVALRTPRGRWVLVDAGPRWQGGDAGRRVVVPYLRRRGGDVALFVLSHAHDDHSGGAATVVRALTPRLWWEPAFITTSPGYREALSAVADAGTRWQRAQPGEALSLDGVRFTVLAPDSTWTAHQTNANETSVMLRVDYGQHRFLLTGDAEHEEEAWVHERWGASGLRADVLKVGHHGSRTSSTEAFIAATAPRLAVVSLGTGNRYGHPAPQTVELFLKHGIPLVRTDLEGAIIVRSNGLRLEVESRGERWTVAERAPP
ncbi:MAG TPA: DNA internalization-related competence protein ComEC/Rec2 [Gemmatimonas sp.]|uniref:DNA internalization-related competence protein ComEC/Rec2 n=1 Tax=Gemmatimonas sp. TaxID=1962908 RepID=UPI002ED892E7